MVRLHYSGKKQNSSEQRDQGKPSPAGRGRVGVSGGGVGQGWARGRLGEPRGNEDAPVTAIVSDYMPSKIGGGWRGEYRVTC